MDWLQGGGFPCDGPLTGKIIDRVCQRAVLVRWGFGGEADDVAHQTGTIARSLTSDHTRGSWIV